MCSLKMVLPDCLSYHVTFYGAIHHSETLSRGPSLELESRCLDLQIPKQLNECPCLRQFPIG